MNRTMKRITLITLDLTVFYLTALFSYLFLSPLVGLDAQPMVTSLLVSTGVYIALSFYFRLFDKINRYTSIKETIVHALVVTFAFVVSDIVTMLFAPLSMRFLFLWYLLAVMIIPASRVGWRIIMEHRMKKEKLNGNKDVTKLRTLIVGAGEGGGLFIRNLQHDPAIEFVGIVDDDDNKKNTTVFGVPVLGKTKDIEKLIDTYDVDQVTIAIPSISSKNLERIVSYCNETDIKVNQMPSVEDMVQGTYEVNEFKEIDVTDLLGRDEVKLDMEKIATQLSGQTILVSGAGGSIGSEICRQIIRFSPKRILLLGHGENSIYLINRELKPFADKNEIDLVPVIADIQDRDRIFKIMAQYKPDRVYHAAAHKHVPLMEYNPTEAVKNNVYGTKNMAEGAKAAGVQSFVMVSTDKAVNPPNVMGATKRIAEMIVTGLNEEGKTNFVAVRFGNVLGSRGSVIPVFKDQIKKGGPITVTDFRMTRYFMTIPEASRLVLQAGSLARGGEIFVLDMGEPVKIVDLAKQMIQLSGAKNKDIKITESGIRPGEKLYEELLSKSENTRKQVYEKIFIGKVTNTPLNDVLNFVRRLERLSDEELKEQLVAFANNKIKLEEPETNEETEMVYA
ncbi:NDP-sugar epimerase, includes UDP-GlcNAc-inverting 4,6-dehydratase FlaA1 and capsular polysaccharide biosynthesis protein EpsC [Alkalibacterium putridalgicola]|uniref:NDP-sugar epimerase, includes UDP-GlcNAc-inverting 4,6-dehydratase FlaA1 and capsular polysaccharide biosynthesis protein EpsC n=1 Tax=Alkalibacterium putridalgicola TaxID=426703 RepID=A0A1H7QNM4_9LACT|nr:nucleoside-diphosphate sugar epimerase/dehydratase [Alkalibacterium putridalgicola]GEK88396.1 short-chain dehydrogenase [Alkalibacterium putridalgicola]SEL49529.1 NDP-sugar epimerase, includes UDP-GlcNAc-inverting 4,6-dehydratase FlaA1 and capsular polysaccharide biosynthesis protein EpsC [Alkalibacterium putridalgicola]